MHQSSASGRDPGWRESRFLGARRRRRGIAILALICIAGPTAAAASDSCGSLGSIRWLLGQWTAKSGASTVLESWTEAGARTFEGRGETRSTASDEIQAEESLRIVEMSGEVFYLAKVAHNELPVPFKLTACSDTVAVFENAGHEFPKRLEYRRSGEDQLLVRVTDGSGKGFELRFVRTE